MGTRTSSYVIYVDLPEDSRRTLLVHGYSGAFDVVSRGVADYLRSHESGPAPRPLYGEWPAEEPAGPAADPSPATLERLAARGYLTTSSVEEERRRFEGLVGALHERAQRQATYVFVPTYDCNLRCDYCFQDALRAPGSDRRLLRVMSPDLVGRIFAAIDADERAAAHPPAGPPDFGLFGGEPLLAANRPTVEAVVRAARARGAERLWAISNATELDAYSGLLGPGGITELQITLDGPPELHDQRRIYPDGAGSYARTASGVTAALAAGAKVHIRVNVDRTNFAGLVDLAEEVLRRGWADSPLFSIGTQPLRAVNAHTDKATTFTSWELGRAVAELHANQPATAVIGGPDERLRRAARSVLERGSAPRFRAEYCGAHAGMSIFDPLGDVYACWERLANPAMRIGRVTSAGVLERNNDLLRLWRDRSVGVTPACRVCRYALYCGGGCAVLAEGHRGTIRSNYCDGFAKRFRASVADAFSETEAARDTRPPGASGATPTAPDTPVPGSPVPGSPEPGTRGLTPPPDEPPTGPRRGTRGGDPHGS